MPERLCMHEPCRCQPAPGERWCDPRCEEAERRRRSRGTAAARERCSCGHPECRPENAERFASSEAPVP